MRSLKSSWHICLQNLRKWQTDYRIWIIGLMAVILIAVFEDGMRNIADYLGLKPPIWIFPFIYYQFYTKLSYMVLIILLFCNAPFTDQNQVFVLMRSGHKKWLLGQILYIVTASGLFYAFLLAVSLLLSVFGAEFSWEWGDVIKNIVANPLIIYDANGRFVEISHLITTFFKPVQAVWFTLLLSFLCTVFIGLLIFFCNLVTGTKSLGIFISGALAAFSSMVDNAPNYMLRKAAIHFSPFSWMTLNNVDVGNLTVCPSFTYCVCVYLILIAALTAAIFIFGRKKSVDVK